MVVPPALVAVLFQRTVTWSADTDKSLPRAASSAPLASSQVPAPPALDTSATVAADTPAWLSPAFNRTPAVLASTCRSPVPASFSNEKLPLSRNPSPSAALRPTMATTGDAAGALCAKL